MFLGDLLDGIADSIMIRSLDDAARAISIDALTIDSRMVGAGSLFACIAGTRHDGHDHAVDAVSAGAAAILAERPLPLIESQCPVVIVPRVRSLLGPIAARLNGYPSKALTIVGVTGTNGKTTVTHLVESIALAAERQVGVLGTLGARWNGREYESGLTTPEAHALQGLLAAMRDDHVEVVVMEVSSHALEFARIDGTQFAAVGFTNLSSEHLDLHGDIEGYFAAKSRLFGERFAATATIAVDDRWGSRLAQRARENGLDVTTVATVATQTTEANLVAVDVVVSLSGTSFVARDGERTLAVELSLLGRFNVANALVAIGLARSIGFSDAEIARGLAAARPVPGRLERVAEPASIPERPSFTVVVDYAHTPAALETVLDALRELIESTTDGGRLIVVYGCGGDRDSTKRPLMGRAVAARAELAILTSDNPRGEDPAVIASEVLGGLGASDPKPIVELDRAIAIERAIAAARAGDIVVIAGKGHESGQTVGDITVPFDDRFVARDVLSRRGGGR